MPKFRIEQSRTETYTPAAGLALVGHCINQHTSLAKSARSIPKRHGIPNIDLFRTYAGLLCLGKSDFEAAESMRADPFFRQALGIKQSPSAPRLRQRFDEDASAIIPLIDAASVEFIGSVEAPITPLSTGHVALDIDVFPQDNSRTRKEAVSYTYKGYDGYAPIAAYLGNEGWCLSCELRPGSQHAQKEFGYTLERVLPRVRKLTTAPVLVRLDGAHDAECNRHQLRAAGLDYLIKWNPRQQDLERWLAEATERGAWVAPREGKREALFSVERSDELEGERHPWRLLVRLIERTIDRKGQLLLTPEIEIEGWVTSLPQSDYDDATLIGLYRGHALCEQFHSEFKTDLDLQRLPSGKFDTNDLVMAFGAFVYNILRWMGLRALLGKQAPIRHPAKRRRLRTVMQELVYLAARLIRTGRQMTLRFSQHCPGYQAFRQLHAEFP
jgi:Transposase DDE domain group 1